MYKHKHLLITLSLLALMQSPQSKATPFPWVQVLSSWANRVKAYSTTLPAYWRATSGTQKTLMCGLALASSYGIYKGITSLMHNYRTKALSHSTKYSDGAMTAQEQSPTAQSSSHKPCYSVSQATPFAFLQLLPPEKPIPAPSSIGVHAILEAVDNGTKRYFAVRQHSTFDLSIDKLHEHGFLIKPTERDIATYQTFGVDARNQFLINRNITIFFDKAIIDRDETAKKFYENPLYQGQVRLIPLS
jgi:hypothetical protein